MTYDTGMLVALERDVRRAWALHARILARGLLPVVPSVVLAQAWRGGPQPSLSRALAGCAIEPLDEARSRAAGRACARAGTRDIVDAAVVVSALARRSPIVTSDPDDLTRIAAAVRRRVGLVVV